MSKKATQQTSSGTDVNCPYCKGKIRHGKNQRPACKKGTLRAPANASGTTTGDKS